jgi:urea carboxylase
MNWMTPGLEKAIMTVLADGSRVSFGADEFVFVELSEEMSLATTLRVVAITDELRSREVKGLVDICPAHVSYMLRVHPEDLDPRDVVGGLQEIHGLCDASGDLTVHSRLIDMPILYDDPWTRETLLRFRDRHQAPELTDLEYCARVNGFDSVDDFVSAHSGDPFMATFIGFVPGNAESYQLVPRERQLEVPKYLRPRTDTPDRALGHGGAFATIYPVRGAGGFQLLGRSAAPVFESEPHLVDFAGGLVLPRSGDIFKYHPVDMDEYGDIRKAVDDGSYRYRIAEVAFNLAEFAEDPDAYNRRLLAVLR